MSTIILHRYRYRSPNSRRLVTSCHHTPESAALSLPSDAEVLPHTREERQLPDAPHTGTYGPSSGLSPQLLDEARRALSDASKPTV